LSEPSDRIRSGKVVREDRFLVRHRLIQFSAVCETEEDAQTILRALETAYDAAPVAPPTGAMRCEKVHGDGLVPDGLVEQVERIIDILHDSRFRGQGARIEDATEALQELRRRLIAGEAMGKDEPMPGYTIEVYYDVFGNHDGKRGCFRARMQGCPEIHDAGRTPEEAYEACVVTAGSFGFPRGDHNYRMDLLRLEK
jgi:hypothetical protein